MLYLLIAVGICLLVPWLPVVISRLAPVRPVPPLSAEEMDRLTLRSYQWVNWVILPVFLVTMLGLALAWAMLFDFLGNEHAKTFPPGVFVFKPEIYWAIFGVPAIFLGIFGSVVILEPLTRILLGRRYAEYCYWEQARRGLSGSAGVHLYGKRFVLFAIGLGALMALWVLLAMNWYLRLTETEIVLKPLFGLGEQHHSYRQIQQIVLTTHARVKQDVVPREGLHLRFDDGQTWNTGQSFALPETPEERERLLEFLRQKTGKPLTRARLIENVPGW